MIHQVPLTQIKVFQACQFCQLSWNRCYLIVPYKTIFAEEQQGENLVTRTKIINRH